MLLPGGLLVHDHDAGGLQHERESSREPAIGACLASSSMFSGTVEPSRGPQPTSSVGVEATRLQIKVDLLSMSKGGATQRRASEHGSVLACRSDTAGLIRRHNRSHWRQRLRVQTQDHTTYNKNNPSLPMNKHSFMSIYR